MVRNSIDRAGRNAPALYRLFFGVLCVAAFSKSGFAQINTTIDLSKYYPLFFSPSYPALVVRAMDQTTNATLFQRHLIWPASPGVGGGVVFSASSPYAVNTTMFGFGGSGGPLTLDTEGIGLPTAYPFCEFNANPGIPLPTTNTDPGQVQVVASMGQYYSSCGGLPAFVSFTATRGLPIRISAEDGTKIETLPLVFLHDGLPWRTLYFGYQLGLVQVTSQNSQVPLEFHPVSLPAPQADGAVVEYRNTIDFPEAPGGHFFYTADPAQQAAVDSGQYGQFVRTGKSFNAGGYVPTCRFYGSMHPGPNSHFFSASEADCNALRALQQTPIPGDVPQWNYEGRSFYSTEAVADGGGVRRCPNGTVPVYRAYNNAYPPSGPKNPWDSNHRFATSQADIDAVVGQYGWRDEGVALCAPI